MVSTNSWALNGTEYKTTISVSAITQDIINKGTVSMFVSPDGTNWVALPYSFQGAEFNYMVTEGSVSITYTKYNGVAPSSAPNNDQFKVVVIAGSARMSNPNVDLRNYHEVKKAFHLKN